MTAQQPVVCEVAAVRWPALQLHVRPGPGAHCVVLGWDGFAPSADAGLPAVLEAVFATALIRCGVLAFLDLPSRGAPRPGWSAIDEDQWLHVPPTLADRLRRRLPPWIVATRSPERARRLFDGAVSWSQQHQVAFVLQYGPLPTLTRRLVRDVLGARSVAIETLELPDEVLALALPGVDGDYFEIAARSQATLDALRSAIFAACERQGIRTIGTA